MPVASAVPPPSAREETRETRRPGSDEPVVTRAARLEPGHNALPSPYPVPRLGEH